MKRRSLKPCSDITGLPAPPGHHGDDPGPPDVPPLSLQWLTEDRITVTQRVWSVPYGRPITRDEAIEILGNVRRLAGILIQQVQEGEQET